MWYLNNEDKNFPERYELREALILSEQVGGEVCWQDDRGRPAPKRDRLLLHLLEQGQYSLQEAINLLM